MQLLQTPHPPRGPPPITSPRRLMADLQNYRSIQELPADSTPPDAALADVNLDGVCVGMAFRFVRVCSDSALGFSVWRPVYGAESDSCDVISPVQLDLNIPVEEHHDGVVLALSAGDVLCEGASSYHAQPCCVLLCCAVLLPTAAHCLLWLCCGCPGAGAPPASLMFLVSGGLASRHIVPTRRGRRRRAHAHAHAHDSDASMPPLAWPIGFTTRLSTSKFTIWEPIPPPGATSSEASAVRTALVRASLMAGVF